ncbi:MAG: hypothetical protein HY904_01945 [Deltaproteobacteria bacterium]|nr:hypothetical protein [Deltaproteobacteria bacterium]
MQRVSRAGEWPFSPEAENGATRLPPRRAAFASVSMRRTCGTSTGARNRGSIRPRSTSGVSMETGSVDVAMAAVQLAFGAAFTTWGGFGLAGGLVGLAGAAIGALVGVAAAVSLAPTVGTTAYVGAVVGLLPIAALVGLCVACAAVLGIGIVLVRLGYTGLDARFTAPKAPPVPDYYQRRSDRPPVQDDEPQVDHDVKVCMDQTGQEQEVCEVEVERERAKKWKDQRKGENATPREREVVK